jgi:hypothetical protein
MPDKTDIITAPGNEVFCVTYTYKLEKKIFYKFFGTRYEQARDILKFTDARVPISIPVGGASVSVGQEIKPPELDKKSTTIFILRMQKPAWFDRTESDAEEFVMMSESGQAGLFERLFNESAAQSVLGGK